MVPVSEVLDLEGVEVKTLVVVVPEPVTIGVEIDDVELKVEEDEVCAEAIDFEVKESEVFDDEAVDVEAKESGVIDAEIVDFEAKAEVEVEDEVVDELALAAPEELLPGPDNEEVKVCPLGWVVTVTTCVEEETGEDQGEDHT